MRARMGSQGGTQGHTYIPRCPLDAHFMPPVAVPDDEAAAAAKDDPPPHLRQATHTTIFARVKSHTLWAAHTPPQRATRGVTAQGASL